LFRFCPPSIFSLFNTRNVVPYDPKFYYRRRLPHYQPANETFHVIFRLFGSLPRDAISNLRSRRDEILRQLPFVADASQRKRLLGEWHQRYFDQIDAVLERAQAGPRWLQLPAIADLVATAIHFRDSSVYDLLAFCVMPNHVHLLVYVERSDASLYRILQSLKSYTAIESNSLLGRSGPFWQHESYDHVIRDSPELYRTIWYILENPVKAGLCTDWRDWKWSYVKDEVFEF
jgi:putative transposase